MDISELIKMAKHVLYARKNELSDEKEDYTYVHFPKKNVRCIKTFCLVHPIAKL